MATTELTDTDRYTIISVDGHAGAALLDYRPYLASKWHDEFDAWAASYTNPFSDLLASTAYRNWDSEARLAYELRPGGNIDRHRQVDTAEHHAGVHRRGPQRDPDFLAGVQAYAGGAAEGFERALPKH